MYILARFVEESSCLFINDNVFLIVSLFFINIIDREKCIFCGRSWKNCEEAQSVAKCSGSDKAILHGKVQLHSSCA